MHVPPTECFTHAVGASGDFWDDHPTTTAEIDSARTYSGLVPCMRSGCPKLNENHGLIEFSLSASFSDHRREAK